eukprot:s2461_g1.t1
MPATRAMAAAGGSVTGAGVEARGGVVAMAALVGALGWRACAHGSRRGSWFGLAVFAAGAVGGCGGGRGASRAWAACTLWSRGWGGLGRHSCAPGRCAAMVDADIHPVRTVSIQEPNHGYPAIHALYGYPAIQTHCYPLKIFFSRLPSKPPSTQFQGAAARMLPTSA